MNQTTAFVVCLLSAARTGNTRVFVCMRVIQCTVHIRNRTDHHENYLVSV